MKFKNKKTGAIYNVVTPTLIEIYKKNKDYIIIKNPSKEENKNNNNDN